MKMYAHAPVSTGSCIVPVARTATSQRSASLSTRVWGLDWSTVLPWSFEGGATLESGTFEDALPFMAEHYPDVMEKIRRTKDLDDTTEKELARAVEAFKAQFTP